MQRRSLFAILAGLVPVSLLGSKAAQATFLEEEKQEIKAIQLEVQRKAYLCLQADITLPEGAFLARAVAVHLHCPAQGGKEASDLKHTIYQIFQKKEDGECLLVRDYYPDMVHDQHPMKHNLAALAYSTIMKRGCFDPRQALPGQSPDLLSEIRESIRVVKVEGAR